jgi:TolA-binding protein
MVDKVLCFRLNGYSLGVEPEQIEKILINKRPSRDAFTLETGVEVKKLSDYIPLPARKNTQFENILFVKDQKYFYGFSVDNVLGYLKLRGGEKLGSKGSGKSPIRYFVRKEEYLIPVLDLQYITNEEAPLASEVVQEIVQTARLVDEGEGEAEREEVLEDVHKDEIFRAIEDEISRKKTTAVVDDIIESEKRGVVLPLVINLVIVAIFAAGLLFYLTFSGERVREQTLGDTISGVEDEVIREIRRRSEQEIEAQKQKLEETRTRLASLMEERDFFLENQDKILAEREAELSADFQTKLDDARRRLLESGVENFDAAFDEERVRLQAEYNKSLEEANTEIDKVKIEYEREMAEREDVLRREVTVHSSRIDEIEQQLVEEQAKLKEAELQVQSAVSQQQEYNAYRRSLTNIYRSAITAISREDYEKGITELKTAFPLIDSAKKAGLGTEVELQVEEDLLNSIISIAENQQGGVVLNRMAQTSFDRATDLEKSGNLTGALSHYYTAYTITGNRNLKNLSIQRADDVMDQIYQSRLQSEIARKEGSADALFSRAVAQKDSDQYELALNTLEELVQTYPETSKVDESFEEIRSLNRLILMHEEQNRIDELNQQASQVMRQAEDAFEEGYLSEALNRYGEVVSEYYGSDYVDVALSEISRISEVMRSVKTTPQVVFGSTDTRTGVIIQIPTENTYLFNLGMQDGLKEGDVMGIFRKEDETFTYIGSVKVYEVFPTVSKAKVIYYEQPFKIGDFVSPS